LNQNGSLELDGMTPASERKRPKALRDDQIMMTMSPPSPNFFPIVPHKPPGTAGAPGSFGRKHLTPI